MKSFLKSIVRNIQNIPGWKSDRKIIVIESDDWGSIRAQSKEAVQRLSEKGMSLEKCPYSKYDKLESADDLTGLFEVLNKFKDKNNNPPVFTANTIVTNPDFEKIRQKDFSEYHYEIFPDTLKKYGNDNVIDLYHEGNNLKLFHPQFHGREHLNVERWLRALRSDHHQTKLLFEENMFGMGSHFTVEKKFNYMRAFDYDFVEDARLQKAIILDGLSIFRNIFGYESRSFIAPGYTWGSHLHGILKTAGVDYIQGKTYQIEPLPQPVGYKKKYHFTGQKNSSNQIYLVRNCFFEPSIYPNIDWLNDCMYRIGTAFRWGNPAIIGTHRLNYIGGIIPGNREKNLKLLGMLLEQIVHKWPQVEFMTTPELGRSIYNVDIN